MKKINPVRINDPLHLDTLAENTLLAATSFPELKREKANVIKAYDDYDANAGNVWNIPIPTISGKLLSGLLSHYDSPPESLNFLDRITKSSPEVCPMCGGFKPSTRDHILPKAQYQILAIFSKNLVPACDCNMKRNDAVKGDPATQARILHPYYDGIMSDRLLSCEITHKDNFRIFNLKIIFVNPAHPEIAAIKYHTKNVVIKSGAEGWLKGQLSKIKERPSNVIQTLPRKRHQSVAQVIDCINDCLDRNEELTGTPNNWLSILCHGILNSAGVVDWITDRHNATLVT